MNKKLRLFWLCIVSFFCWLLLSMVLATPSNAHWADLAVAEIVVEAKSTQMTLTLPTGLVATADANRDGQLSTDEVNSHQKYLREFLSDRIRFTDQENHPGSLTVKPTDISALPPNLAAPVNTHSTLLLDYSWPQPVQKLKIHYNLFLPGVPTARCLATISNQIEQKTPGFNLASKSSNSQLQHVIFSPENRDLDLMQSAVWDSTWSLLVAIAGAFIWGAMHALSPGHGKTIVGAYLAGSRATPLHALFLGLTTTITHTTGVFVLGLIALFASHFIVPEQLYPWLSLLSGLMVVAIGFNLFMSRMPQTKLFNKFSFGNSHSHSHDHVHSHSHDHVHSHSHHHAHNHSHNHHHTALEESPAKNQHQIFNLKSQISNLKLTPSHSHLPPGADGSAITWRSLLLLGISGGIVPCPSALVVLLSAIALDQIGFGLVLVLAFSLGLALVLTGLGLMLIWAKKLFVQLPTPGRILRRLPAISALAIALVGCGISIQAIVQISNLIYKT
jgi:nickel/cobalt transporter (NicO) family protein